MFQSVISLRLIVVFNDVCFVAAWDPSNFTFNPGDSYELVWQDEFENVGPVKAIINGQPVYSPNPKNWAHILGTHCDAGLENDTDSIQNSYVQNGQLTIVAMKEQYQSAMLTTADIHEFTFGVFAAKTRLPYGDGIWPAWWMWDMIMKPTLTSQLLVRLILWKCMEVVKYQITPINMHMLQFIGIISQIQ
jgi:hypothetical protein